MRSRSQGNQSTRLLLSALAVFGVLVLSVAYILSSVLGLPLTSRPESIQVELTSTGGLFEGSAVTYRGVRVGSVTRIGFTRDGVRATARIDSDTRIPASSRAVVRSLSPVGEQYLDLQPSGTAGPFLHDGSEITASHTDIPKTLASTVIALDRVLDQVDAKRLRTVLVEAHRALRGTGDDVARMTGQGRQIIADLNRDWPRINRLLHNGDTLLRIGIDRADTLTQTARDTRRFTRFLHDFHPTLAKTLRRGPTQLDHLQQLVETGQRLATTFLRRGAGVFDLLDSYDPHLRELLRDFAPGLATLGRAISHHSLQLALIVQRDELCHYRVTPRDPTSVRRHPLRKDGHCPASLPFLQRGAAHAPGPVLRSR